MMESRITLFLIILYLNTSWATPTHSSLAEILISTSRVRPDMQAEIDLLFKNKTLGSFETTSSQSNIKYASNCDASYVVDDDDEVILTSRVNDSWYICAQNFSHSGNKSLSITCPLSSFNYGHCWFESLGITTDGTINLYCSNTSIPDFNATSINIHYTRRTWYNYGAYKCIIHVSKYNYSDLPYLNNSQCSDAGRRNNIETKIIGGENAQKSEFPWMAYLIIKETHQSYLCGGVLIAVDLVLTAAHCVSGPVVSILVGLGKWNIKNVNEQGSITMYAKNYIKHKSFSNSTRHNDIALLLLSKKVTFTAYVKPACLPASENYNVDGHVATAAGWGFTEYGGVGSDILQKVDLNIYSNDDCHDYWKKVTTILSSQLCAIGHGKDTCSSDSGGPLFIKDDNNYVIIGLTSYGYKCAVIGSPGVYTRVSKYLDWIHTTKDKLRTAPLSNINDNNIKATEL